LDQAFDILVDRILQQQARGPLTTKSVEEFRTDAKVRDKVMKNLAQQVSKQSEALELLSVAGTKEIQSAGVAFQRAKAITEPTKDPPPKEAVLRDRLSEEQIGEVHKQIVTGMKHYVAALKYVRDAHQAEKLLVDLLPLLTTAAKKTRNQ